MEHSVVVRKGGVLFVLNGDSQSQGLILSQALGTILHS